MTVAPEQATEAANTAFGRHPGFRALHAKGTLLRGTFTATPDAAALTRAAHMQGDQVAATVRVSNGSGNPRLPDYAPDVRGLAVKFYLSGGERTDIVAQTAPRFPVKTPEGFLDLLVAGKPSLAATWRLPLFLARHPEAIPRLPANVAALRPPVSYATCRYYAIHAYRFIDRDGAQRYVRYTWLPEADDKRLSPLAARRRGRDYLQQEIRERLQHGPVRFTLQLQVAEPGDNPDDPTADWPTTRRRIDAGLLEITELETGRETGGDVLVFDPSRVTDGIELSGDPVLRFRPKAYSDSVARRTSGR
jgi:catalase